MHGGTISGNTALAFGGGVGVQDNGSFTMHNGTISGNTGNAGGGVSAEDGSSFTMNGGTISGNTGSSGGGVIVLSGGSFTMYNGAIRGNTVTHQGGGVGSFGGGVFTMHNGEISGNAVTNAASTNGGGGVYLQATGNFDMRGGVISGNTNATARNSGGVYADNDFTMSGAARITANNAVYLPTNSFIIIGGALTASAPVATIAPSDYLLGRSILSPASPVDAATLAAAAARFAVLPGEGKRWKVDAAGKLVEQ
jgi:hypothetical protein